MPETAYNRIYGEYLGYPACCIEAFGDVATPFFTKSQIVQENARNDFIPCKECAERLAKGEISYEDLINPQRDCTIPFKDKHTAEEEEQINNELNALQDSQTEWYGEGRFKRD